MTAVCGDIANHSRCPKKIWDNMDVLKRQTGIVRRFPNEKSGIYSFEHLEPLYRRVAGSKNYVGQNLWSGTSDPA